MYKVTDKHDVNTLKGIAIYSISTLHDIASTNNYNLLFHFREEAVEKAPNPNPKLSPFSHVR